MLRVDVDENVIYLPVLMCTFWKSYTVCRKLSMSVVCEGHVFFIGLEHVNCVEGVLDVTP